MNKSAWGDMVEAVREWAGRLRKGSVQIAESDLELEQVIEIRPAAPGASRLTLRLGKSVPTLDIGMGAEVQFEDLPFDRELLADILDAVKDGHLRETVIESCGRVVWSRGELRLRRGTWFAKRTTLFPYLWSALFSKAPQRVIEYEPYE